MKSSTNNIDLVEGEHYTIENGLYVWTKYYLQERGYCCDNDCRNCPYDFSNDKKVISLVPSWTDTLLECDVKVVGRTRFCINPAEKIADIPVVGGTKTLKAEKLAGLNADLAILDKQENPFEFLEQLELPIFSSDVISLESLLSELIRLNILLKSKKLNTLIFELDTMLARPQRSFGLEKLPGVIEWLKQPEQEVNKILYMIWRDPWMCVSVDTFIGSMFDYLGFPGLIPKFETKYPKIVLEDYDEKSTLLLFSSEPFPFDKKTEELKSLNYPSAIVDGESFSWFGSTAIRFLQQNT
ncbi:MAG: Fe3+-siderophores ABC transporter protein [Gammaproteobacteria bacterium]|nr:Fe3+-siderophores ABC transporter protein [Gammaproteobacteria bacterium]